MSGWAQGAVGFALALSLLSSQALAEKRVALVIGNSAYQQVEALPNPRNDAAAMAALFNAAGFDVVAARQDLGMVELRRAVREFASLAREADVAAVFFAGHGVEVDGTNYLVPVDARLASDFDVEDETISLDRVLAALEPAKSLRLVILDACRDNPFIARMNRAGSTRAIRRGLARVEPTTVNTLVAFAAKAGSTASDGGRRNSPFTAALIKHLAEPGLDLRIAFGRVRDEVLATTARAQEPFVYGSLGGTPLSLVPPLAEPKRIEAAKPPAVADVNAAMRQDYELAAAVGTMEAWESFLAVYGSGFYADLARAQRAKLVAARQKTSGSLSAQALAPRSEAPSQAAIDDVEKKLPKRETAIAALPEATTAPSRLDPVKPPIPTSARALAVGIQRELLRLGCWSGHSDGKWGPSTRAAVGQFNRYAKTHVGSDNASEETLATLQRHHERVCPLTCARGLRAQGNTCVAIRSEPPSPPQRVDKPRPQPGQAIERPPPRPSGQAKCTSIQARCAIEIGGRCDPTTGRWAYDRNAMAFNACISRGSTRP